MLRFAGPFAPAMAVTHKDLVRGFDVHNRVVDGLAAIGGTGKGAGDDLEEASRAQNAVIRARVHARLAHRDMHGPVSVGAKDLVDHVSV